jgi:hypothetical protein
VLRNCEALERLPEGLAVPSLDVSGCRRLARLPAGLSLRVLKAAESGVAALPESFRVFDLDLSGAPLERLPDGLAVESRLVLAGCERLKTLPANLRVGTLVLRGCVALTELPAGLDVWFLDLQGCTGLTRWPERLNLRNGRLSLRGCRGLPGLPPRFERLAALDVGDCPQITELPDGLHVTGWIDVAGSGLRGLPPSLRDVQIRWRGVRVDERIAFRPESLAPRKILAEANSERRRVMLERVGLERFFDAVNAEELDADSDPGGPRRLLRVPLPGDEDLVCLVCNCPSTARRYALRVPPVTRTCHQAAA